MLILSFMTNNGKKCSDKDMCSLSEWWSEWLLKCLLSVLLTLIRWHHVLLSCFFLLSGGLIVWSVICSWEWGWIAEKVDLQNELGAWSYNLLPTESLVPKIWNMSSGPTHCTDFARQADFMLPLPLPMWFCAQKV